MRPPRPLVALLLLAAALVVAACGATTVRHVTTTVTRSTSSPATTPTVEGETTRRTSPSGGAPLAHRHRRPRRRRRPPGPALAARSPRAILAAAAAALRRVGNYSMHADLRQGGTHTIVDLSAVSNRRYEAATTVGRTSFQLIVLSRTVYLRANAPFWLGQARHSAAARSRARRLAGRWLLLPARDGRSIEHSLGTLAPGTLARCLTEDHGRLTVERRRRVVEHRRAVIVRDAGNAPGATPSTIAVAAAGVPYPLRYVATGRTRRGGRIDVCNDGRGAGATGTITLGRFGETPALQPPAGARSGAGVTT
ncbi:MAG TPA: hypothetical protein VKV21_10155 [Solirubrobacteraceae bacterium]|nr:hypothetical protein [Solirubrobacteraceae bacterium]